MRTIMTPVRPLRPSTALFLVLAGMIAPDARSEDQPAPLLRRLKFDTLLRGPWDRGAVNGEGLLFVRGADGVPSARLLFDADRVLSVYSADRSRTYEAGRDYRLADDGSILILPPGSRIASRDEADFFLPNGAPHSIPHRAGHPETSLLFGEGHFFHDMQVEVRYIPRRAAWTGDRPEFAGDRLPKTVARLRAKRPLTIAVSGDSISQGYNASGYTKAPPLMPPYPDLVARSLGDAYGAKVTLRNHAIAGWSAGQGVNDFDNLLKDEPDLLIIAYGMNDVGGRNPEGFKANIAIMLRRLKEARPDAEVVLVASMIGNPDWAATPTEMFPKYRDALTALTGPGVALADLTAVWQTLLKRKRFADLTGNGVNHPNDYGHRLYAQAILALLIDPALIGPREPVAP